VPLCESLWLWRMRLRWLRLQLLQVHLGPRAFVSTRAATRAARDPAQSSPPGMTGRPRQSSIEPGFSFQFGRTSIRRPCAPHLAHTTLLANHVTNTSPGYFDTSITAWWRQKFEAPPTTACNSRRGLEPLPEIVAKAPRYLVHHTIGGLTMRERIRSLIVRCSST
jgi:hypothetical protein